MIKGNRSTGSKFDITELLYRCEKCRSHKTKEIPGHWTIEELNKKGVMK